MRKKEIQHLIFEAEELLFRLEDLYRAYDALVGEDDEEKPVRRPQPQPRPQIPQVRWAPIGRMLPAPQKDAIEEWILRGPVAPETPPRKPSRPKNGRQRLRDIFPPGFLPEEYYDEDF